MRMVYSFMQCIRNTQKVEYPYKLNERGKYLVKIDRWYPSSQTCCKCGLIHPEMKDLTNREMICCCGNHMDRDVNAAINILTEGLFTLPA